MRRRRAFGMCRVVEDEELILKLKWRDEDREYDTLHSTVWYPGFSRVDLKTQCQLQLQISIKADQKKIKRNL